KLIRGADINVEVIGDGIMLTGTVSSQADAQQACNIASHFVVGDSFAGGSSSSSTSSSPSGGTAITLTNSNSSSNGSGGGSGGGPTCKVDKVVTSIVVAGRDQVMLKVTVAEMDRTVLKQLGVNLNGSLNLGT